MSQNTSFPEPLSDGSVVFGIVLLFGRWSKSMSVLLLSWDAYLFSVNGAVRMKTRTDVQVGYVEFEEQPRED